MALLFLHKNQNIGIIKKSSNLEKYMVEEEMIDPFLSPEMFFVKEVFKVETRL